MGEVSESYIKQLQSTFHKFLSVIEYTTWITTAGIEEVKSAFKLVNFVEKSSLQLEEKNCLDDFILFLKNERSNFDEQKYTKDFFMKAGDALLSAMFYHENMTADKIDIAIRVYIVSFERERFESFLDKYIQENAASEALLDFIIENKEDIDCLSLKHNLYLHELYNRYRLQEQTVKDFINNSLSAYNVENNLDAFIGVIALDKVETKCEPLQQLILDCVLSKMYDRSVISKPFWVCLFKKVNKSSISKACKNFKQFLELFCGFIIYLGSMMECQFINGKNMWFADPKISLCPEISYDDVIDVLKQLYNEKEIEGFIHGKLVEAGTQVSCTIWQDVQKVVISKKYPR